MPVTVRLVPVWAPVLGACVLAAGCKRIEPYDPFDPDSDAEVPSWIAQEFQDRKGECESALYYDETEYATLFAAGTFFEDGDAVLGNEFWLFWPNPKFQDTGFTECMVVFDIAGSKRDSTVAGAAYAYDIQATVDEDQTDCPEGWDGTPIYAGEEQWNETYNIVETPNDGISLLFNSGNSFATGTRYSNGFEWMQTERECWAL